MLPFVEALALRLTSAGVAVDRITTGVPILHPQLDTSSVVWTEGSPTAERSWIMAPEHYVMRQNSPLHSAYFHGESSRAVIGAERVPGEFGVVDDLRKAGFADYMVLPAPFSDGSFKAMSFATRSRDGFRDSDVALLTQVMPAVALIMELITSYRTSRTLLTTFLGQQIGERVLKGQVRRGQADEIPAVIWFSDLRGSTPLAEALEPRAFLDLLNAYLECMAEAVLEHDGEVLRFIGDAALGIFPITADNPVGPTCARAIKAGRSAIGRMEALNNERRQAGLPSVEFGVGLHVGDVLYGNIGAATRLEFTVIGAAANEAARIEGLCKTLGHRLLVSDKVATHVPERVTDLGLHALRGVGSEVRIFSGDAPAAN